MPAVHLQENTKLISGHVAEKKGYLYWVLNITENGKRKPKWIPTHRKARGNKTWANNMLPAVRKEWTEKLLRESTITDNFSLLASKENQVMAEVSFVDFLYQWLEHKYRTATGRAIDAKPIELSTYAGYEQQLNNPIAPYFREHPISLSALTKEDILAFYEKELERVKPSTVKHYHALIHGALNYAVDKKAIIEAVYQGAGTPAKNPLPPTIWSYNDEIQDYPYDPEKAKQLLAEAGFPNGFETDFWIQPVVRASNPNPKRMAELVMADWAKVGVKANPVTFEWADYQKRAKAGELTAGIFGWSGDNGDPDNFLSPLLASSNAGNSNMARFNNAEFDALLDKAIGLTDKEQRSALYKQAQVIVHEQAPWIPVAHSVGFAPLSPRVKGYVQSPFGYDAFYGVSVDGK